MKSDGIWVEAPPIPNTFVCNIGDMLERMTGGLYRSTPHRVLNASGKQRLSFPLFFDSAFDSKVELISGITPVEDDRNNRWDKDSVHDFEGTYGAYLLRKVDAVFPKLRKDILQDNDEFSNPLTKRTFALQTVPSLRTCSERKVQTAKSTAPYVNRGVG